MKTGACFKSIGSNGGPFFTYSQPCRALYGVWKADELFPEIFTGGNYVQKAEKPSEGSKQENYP